MPMIYVSKRTLELLKEIENILKRRIKPPNRVLRTDIIHAALSFYFKKIRKSEEGK